MRTFALSTGSSGNCYYIENKYGDKILIDLGLSFKKTKEILKIKGIDIKEIDGVYITHEHRDHISGLGTFSKKLNKPIFMTKGTLKFIKNNFTNKRINFDNIHKIEKNKCYQLNKFKIYAIEKPHDAMDPVSYVIESDNKKIGIFTDLGYLTEPIKEIIKKLDVIYIEANYSKELISKKGMFYIERCISNYGHLDTEESIKFISEIINDEQKVVFCHISENNNSYEYVEFMFNETLKKNKLNVEYFISFQREPTFFIDITRTNK